MLFRSVWKLFLTLILYGGSVRIKSTDSSGINDIPLIQSSLNITFVRKEPLSSGSACPPPSFSYCCHSVPPQPNAGRGCMGAVQQARIQAKATTITAMLKSRILCTLFCFVYVINLSSPMFVFIVIYSKDIVVL